MTGFHSTPPDRHVPDNDIFEFRGQGVRVLSENELLTKTGERVHTERFDMV